MSQADISRDYHQRWMLIRDPRAVFGTPKTGDTEGQFTTWGDQIGLYSSTPAGRRLDWSAIDLAVSGGWYNVKRTLDATPGKSKTLRVGYCLIDGKGYETIEGEGDSPTLIKHITQSTAPTIQPDGSYTPAQYTIDQAKISPEQDLFTYNRGMVGGTLGKRTGSMTAYTHGARIGHVHSTFARGLNIHEEDNGKTIVEWTHFEDDGGPMTEFETSRQGTVLSTIQVPRHMTGEQDDPEEERSTAGFFMPTV